MTRRDLLATLGRFDSCEAATKWVSEHQSDDFYEIWTSCRRGDWMLWIAAKSGLDRRLVVKAACLCAREALVHVPTGDHIPRIAIETAERWTRGESTIEEVRAASAASSSVKFLISTDNAAAAYADNAAAGAAGTVEFPVYADTAAIFAANAARYADIDAFYTSRDESLAKSAELVRSVIAADTVTAALQGAA